MRHKTKNDVPVVQYAKYIINTNGTIRQTAAHFGVSKSHVHFQFSKPLPDESFSLYKKVRKILDKNLEERHIRGGEATKRSYHKGTHKS